jgi:hypothetical protein
MLRSMREWLHAHDPGYAALRRAGRTALVMPAMFALGSEVLGNTALATFAAFGSFAMLLLVDFGGPMKDRLFNQAALGITCAFLIALATLCSRTTWLAAAVTGLVAFAVLFAGVISSVLAGATLSLLLAFILPTSLPGPVSSIPDRVAGWGLAAAVSLPAIALLWPAPVAHPMRGAASRVARALARRLRAELEYLRNRGDGDAVAAREAAVADADREVAAMQRSFFSTPYRPGGLGTEARVTVRLVNALLWQDAIIARAGPADTPRRAPEARAVKLAAATVLERAADRLELRDGSQIALEEAVGSMRAARRDLEHMTMTTTVARDGDGSPQTVVSALDPSFRAQEMSFVAGRIAVGAELVAAASERSWIDRVLGHQPAPGVASPLTAARNRARARLVRSSHALHNSVRGGVALALSVVVIDLASVQHGFWVLLGTVSVLRSNALSTGEDLARALGGTAVGFAVGGGLVYLVGTNTLVLWALLPVAILCAGLAPAAISFAAGQGAFTLTLVILYNLIVPAGWRIGLIRVEDVAIGGSVSVVVGLLFWPHGAAAELRRALADAYRTAAHYLAEAVAFGVGRCDVAHPSTEPPTRASLAARAAAARLDDAFRSYLTERGAKTMALADLTGIVTGAGGVGLAADGVLELWDADSAEGDRAAARGELLSSVRTVSGWYAHFAASVAGAEPLPAPLPDDDGATERLVMAVERDLRDPDEATAATGVRVIWTGDHVDAVRRLQTTLVGPASDGTSRPAA